MLDIKVLRATHKKWQRLKVKGFSLDTDAFERLEGSDDVYKVKPNNCRTNAM